MALMLQVRPPLKCSLPSREFGVWARKRIDLFNPWKHVWSSPLRMMASRRFELGPMDAGGMDFGGMEVEQLELGAIDAERLESTATAIDEGQSLNLGAMDDPQLGAREKLARKQMHTSNFHTKMNKVSKWLVVAAVAGTVLWRQFDMHTLWAATGSSLNGLFCKILKRVINQERPPTANGVKEDPGMPSSHAQGFFFLGTYAALGLLSDQPLNIWNLLGALGLLLCTTYLSWLRVTDGLHTSLQVLVGGTFGAATAAFWLYMWKVSVGAAVYSSPGIRAFLQGAYVVSSVAILLHMRGWEFGKF